MSTTPRRPDRLTEESVDALLLDTTPWLSCDDCFERMDTYVESLLAEAGHPDPAMTSHLEGCAACREEAAGLIALLETP